MSEHEQDDPATDPALRYIYGLAALPVMYLVGQTVRSAGILAGWWG